MVCVTYTQMYTSGPLVLKAFLSLFGDLKSAYLWNCTTTVHFIEVLRYFCKKQCFNLKDTILLFISTAYNNAKKFFLSYMAICQRY